MKKNIQAIGLAILLASCGGTKSNNSSTKKKVEANPSEYANSITQEDLKTHLYKYASDEFEGRNTGEKGQKLAVEYLKNEYKKLGIASPYKGDDYFQEVPLEKPAATSAEISVDGKSFEAFKHHIVLSLTKSLDIKASDIVNVEYGIDSDKYSDYKNKDVKDKIVFAKAGEPKDVNGNYITSGKTEDTKWTNGRQSLRSKSDVAKDNGAKAFIYYDENLFSRYAPFYQRQAESGSSGRLSIKTATSDFAFLMVNKDLADAITNSPSAKIDIKAERNAEDIISENVVAFIKGSEKPNEILVISAHLDHEGIKDGEVYNGADDDGSGTVALLEIAESFQQAVKDGYKPRRSILFLHVTGEEKGLLGSRYYTDVDPIFPLENTVADLNIDMIGRIDPKRKEGDRNYVYLIGSDKLSTELHNLSEEVNTKYMNIELDYTFNDENDKNRYYYRSDHYNFAKNNVPVIFYFNGTHDDYHRPSDTPDKIEYDLLENRTRLVFYTAWELANRENRPVVDKLKEE